MAKGEKKKKYEITKPSEETKKEFSSEVEKVLGIKEVGEKKQEAVRSSRKGTPKFVIVGVPVFSIVVIGILAYFVFSKTPSCEGGVNKTFEVDMYVGEWYWECSNAFLTDVTRGLKNLDVSSLVCPQPIINNTNLIDYSQPRNNIVVNSCSNVIFHIYNEGSADHGIGLGALILGSKTPKGENVSIEFTPTDVEDSGLTLLCTVSCGEGVGKIRHDSQPYQFQAGSHQGMIANFYVRAENATLGTVKINDTFNMTV